jgi:hypothetical protein
VLASGCPGATPRRGAGRRVGLKESADGPSRALRDSCGRT